MSLINDALRRAKQAQQGAPSPAPPASTLHPVEPSPSGARHSAGLLLPVVLALVALLGLLAVWEWYKKEAASQSQTALAVAAKTPAFDNASATPAAAVNASVEPSAAAHGSALAPSLAAPATAVATPEPAHTSPPPETNGLTSINTETNRSVAIEPAAPPPTPLKLQGIVFNPRRPSALINGRVMFVGDRIRELRIQAIHQGEVVLVGQGRTNLLSLEP